MSQMTDLFCYAELSQAAYADMGSGGIPISSLTDTSVEMTQFQAERFADK